MQLLYRFFPYLAFAFHLFVILSQHGFFIGKPMSPRAICLYKITDASDHTRAPLTSINRSQVDRLGSYLAALAIAPLLIPILPSLDSFDNDICHVPLYARVVDRNSLGIKM